VILLKIHVLQNFDHVHSVFGLQSVQFEFRFRFFF